MIILDNSLFDDGSIECKNFQVANHEDAYICEWSQLQDIFSGAIQKQVLDAIAQGKRYVIIEHETYCEISWD